MELVPIVIKVLEIVSVFAIATLLISYVLFKIRQKTNPTIVASPKDLTPNFVGRGIKRITQMTREILPSVSSNVRVKNYSSPSPERPATSHQQSKVQQIRKPGIDHHQKSMERNPDKRGKHENFSNKDLDPIKKRLEIMNDLQDQNVVNSLLDKEKSAQKTDMNSLGNDILDKYTDDSNTGFYTLKTNKKEEK